MSISRATVVVARTLTKRCVAVRDFHKPMNFVIAARVVPFTARPYTTTTDMKVDQIHHVAYRCKNAKETVDWYKHMLNMDLLVAISEDRCPSTKDPDPYMHIFLQAGPNILAFFEIPNSPEMEVPICGPNTPAWIQHIAFQVADVPLLLQWKANLEAKGLEVVGPTDHAIIQSIYFFDPNGHRVEVTCNTAKPGDFEKLGEVAPNMVEEFSRTKTTNRQAAWLHESEFKDYPEHKQ
jgi:catechol 2,3-dioxygenase-like lactoylglutathione lyase family enzyme